MNARAPAGVHEVKNTLTVDRYVENHPDRTGTPLYEHTRKLLIGGNPGAICMVNNQHCDHDHPLELHHSHVEWCDSLGADWKKVARLVPDFDWGAFDPAHPETFIDSKWNANMVLCKKHHTGPDHGIHRVDQPTFQAQIYLRDDVPFSPDEVPA